MVKLDHFKTLIGLLILLSTQTLWAWGILPAVLDEDMGPSYLVFQVLKTNQINYCLQSKGVKLKYSLPSLRLETESILRQWLRPVVEAGVLKEGQVKIAETGCSQANLQIVFVANESNREISARELPVLANGIWKPQVEINTLFLHQRHPLVDFYQLLGRFQTAMVLRSLEQERSQTRHDQFPRLMGLQSRILEFTTYDTLLHELGHSFGLCDSSRDFLQRYCLADFQNEKVSDSVMSDMSHATLAEDDRQGIVALFKLAQHLLAEPSFVRQIRR